MTRKHFIAIAAAIKEMGKNDADRIALRFMAAKMADTFKTLNPAFDRDRFMTACGF